MPNREAIDYAERYARLGFNVLPLHYPVANETRFVCSCGRDSCKDIAKHPEGRLVPNGFKNATTNLRVVEQWFRGCSWNVGIATGRQSGFFALDIDPRHGGDNSIAALEAEHGTLPPTWRFKTGGSGTHLLFRHPGERVPNSVAQVAPGIDVRGDDGYIVAPPSRHSSGEFYSIAPNFHPDLADAPTWLLSRILPRTSEVDQSNLGDQSLRCGSIEWSPAEEKRVKSALECICADERDVWLRIGMALHSTGWGGQARRMWDDWSNASNKFDSSDQDRTWKRFRHDGHTGRKITLGTLFSLAKKNGWRDPGHNKLIAQAAGVFLAQGIETEKCINLVAEFNALHGDANASVEQIRRTVTFLANRDHEKQRRPQEASQRHG